MCVLVVCTIQQFWCIYDLEKNDMVIFTEQRKHRNRTNDDNVAGSFSCYVLIKYTRNTALNEKIKTFSL